MKLSKKVYLLWISRLFLFYTTLSLCTINTNSVFWQISTPLFVFSFLTVFLFFRLKSTKILVHQDHLILFSGVIIKKEQFIRKEHICAAKTLATPLAQVLKLANPVVHCEGAVLFLPALTKEQIKKLTLFEREI